MLWVYPFWHTNGLIHETLPMAALVALKVVLTGCALLGQLRLWAGQGIFRTGRPWAAAVGLGPWGSPRGRWIGRRRPVTLGELACGAPDSEPREGS